MHTETVDGVNRVVWDKGEQVAKAKKHEREKYSRKPDPPQSFSPVQIAQPTIPPVLPLSPKEAAPQPSPSIPIVPHDAAGFDGTIEKMLAQRMKQITEAAENQKKQIDEEATRKQQAIKDGFYSKLFSLVNSVETDSPIKPTQPTVRAPLSEDKIFRTKPKVESAQKGDLDWKALGGWVLSAFFGSLLIGLIIWG